MNFSESEFNNFLYNSKENYIKYGEYDRDQLMEYIETIIQINNFS